MTQTIYKYELEPADVQILHLPAYAQILSVHNQHDGIQIWALVEASIDTPKEAVEFRIVGTGRDASGTNGCTFLGTVFMGDDSGIVFHVFYKVLN